MFSFEFTINILVMAFSLLAAGLVGFSLRSHQLRKKQLKIIELRKEMTDNHAQILELQKEYVELESRFIESKTPVMGMRSVSRDFENHDLEVLDSAI